MLSGDEQICHGHVDGGRVCLVVACWTTMWPGNSRGKPLGHSKRKPEATQGGGPSSNNYMFSERPGDLSLLTSSSDRISHFLPVNREHHVASLTASQDNTEIIARGSEVVKALIAKRDNRAANDIADTEHLIHDDTVLLNSAYVFLSDKCLEAQLVAAAVVLWVGGRCEDRGDIVIVGGCS